MLRTPQRSYHQGKEKPLKSKERQGITPYMCDTYIIQKIFFTHSANFSIFARLQNFEGVLLELLKHLPTATQTLIN